MQVKGTRNGGLPIDPPTLTGEDGNRPCADEAAAAPAGTAPAGEVAEVNPADLEDPVKLEAILRRYLGEFLESASQRMDIPVSDADKSALVRFLMSDPLVQGKLIKYLKRE